MSSFLLEKSIIIPGAQKSGTSTLFELLTKHPSVYSPFIKEPQFFALDEEIIAEKSEWYADLYGSGEKYAIDGSTFYLSSKQAPSLIKKYIAEPKVIIVLRDPVKRAYSGFYQMAKRTPRADKRTFNSILSQLEGVDSAESLIRAENDALKKAVEKDQIVLDYCQYLKGYYGEDFRNRLEDKFWPFKYFQESLYSNKVERYEEGFGENLKVIFSENLFSNPRDYVKELYEFLGLDPDIIEEVDIPHRNKTTVPRSEAFRTVVRNIKKIPLAKKVIHSFDSSLREMVKAPFSETKPELSQEQYKRIREILEFEYEQWFSKREETRNIW